MKGTSFELDNAIKTRILGVVLLGTPHFQAGLKQWAMVYARKSHKEESNRNMADLDQEQRDREMNELNNLIEKLVKTQETFCKAFIGLGSNLNILCCFADVLESKHVSVVFVRIAEAFQHAD